MSGSKAYLHRALQPDRQLGFVEFEGKVYESRFGPDKYVGWVDLANGRIYEARFGPDQYLGRVNLDNGKVFRHRPGAPDEYLGDIDINGNLFIHRPLAPDKYVGNITPMPGYAQAGAAFLLLLWPELEEDQKKVED